MDDEESFLLDCRDALNAIEHSREETVSASWLARELDVDVEHAQRIIDRLVSDGWLLVKRIH